MKKSEGNLRPFKKGVRDPRQGRGPKKGAPNAGRPTDAFKEMCRELASSVEVERQVRAILKNGSADPMFLGALRWCSDHGYGRPQASLDVASGGKTLAELLNMGWREKGS